MEVKSWTQEELLTQYPHCDLLKDVVHHLEEDAKNLGKVVCTITLNGRKLNEDDEIKFAGTSVTGIESLSVELEETRKLVADTLITLRDGLVAMQNRALSVADMVRVDPAGPAHQGFSSLMEEARYLTEALRALRHRMVETDQQARLWRAAEAKSQAVIRELIKAFQAQDFVLVGDVLEYEMFNLMESWIHVIDSCDFT